MTKPDEVRFSTRFAPDEPDLYGVEGQQIVQAFTQDLRDAGLNPSTRMYFRDAAGGGAASLGEYLVPLADFAKIAVPVVVAWLTGRAGRKIEFQSGDIKVTACKREDVETLVRLAQEASRKTDPDEQTPGVDPADRAERGNRMDVSTDEDEFSFRLIPAPDEKGSETLAGVGALIKALTDAGVHHVPPRMAFDAVDGGGISVHEFTLLLTALTGPPSAVIIAWLNAKRGRGCKVTGVDGVIEAPTAADAEALMHVQHELKDAAKKGKRKRKKRD